MHTNLTEYKKEFEDRRGIHFNNAGMAPIPRVVAERAIRNVTETQFDASLANPPWTPEVKKARERLAHFLGAEIDQIAFTQNCAQALSQAALGFPLSAQDSVVTVDQEYASNFYPWQVACERSGAKLIVVNSEIDKQLSLEKLISVIKPGVKLVGVSWVQFQTGSILDLKTLGDHCHSVGAFLIVDGIQGLGQLPFSFRDLPVDFIAGASHKWMCGMNGQGFLAVKPELLEKLNPLVVGSLSFNRFGTFADPNAHLEKSARKFEAGGLAYLPLFAMDSAIALIESVGLLVIEKEIARLSQILRKELVAMPKVELATPLEQAGGITSFKIEKNAELKFLKLCHDESVAIAKRGEFIRVSLHAFCNEQEIAKMLNLLRESVSL